MRVLCFGTYERLFPRNTTMIAGLRLAGVEVIECHEPLWELTRDKTGSSFTNPLALLRTGFRMLRAYWRLTMLHRRCRDYDVMVVGYMGYLDMLPAALLARMRRRPLVYSPVVSLHETVVTDRKMYADRSLPGRLAWHLDRLSLRLARMIVLETDTYVDYFSSEFRIPRERFVTVRLGADEQTFTPRPRRDDDIFRVFFYGKFTPLQGVPVIVRAAARVQQLNPAIRFEIVGSGQLTGEVERLSRELALENTDFIPWAAYEELPDHIGRAHVSLGIFGETEKTRRGIPVKVFDALAMGKALVTGDTPAARELLVHGENALLCPTGDPESLARAIIRLHDEPDLLERIADGAARTFREQCTQERIGLILLGHFQTLVPRERGGSS